jgi:DNA-binding Xre family transcriptional regulator
MAKNERIIFRLDEILKEKNRGIRDLARATGLSVATVSRIVNNHTRGMYLDVLGKICTELKIAPGEIYKVVTDKK